MNNAHYLPEDFCRLTSVRTHCRLWRKYRIAGEPTTLYGNGNQTAMLRWSQEQQVEWHYIALGKLQQNASEVMDSTHFWRRLWGSAQVDRGLRYFCG